jgi:predicted CXXCH cytochrome family protein
VIEGKLWESEPHKIPACVDCHQPHKVRRVFYPAGVANKDCLVCHGKTDLATTRDGKAVSLFVDESAYAGSTHKGVGCAQCHSDVDPSHVRPCETVKKKADCSACHAEVVGQYQSSVHGTLRAKGDPDAPVCLDCHSKHATQSKKTRSSPTFPSNVPALCARCHREGEKAAVRIDSEVKDIVAAYGESIHGKGLKESGLVVTATCVSCHTAHGELPPTDPKSSVHKSNVADTCGACHDGIESALKKSVHWPGNTKTDKALPTCNDCHSSHTIRRTDAADFRIRMVDQCGRCHEDQAKTFFDTFHGKVSRLGGSATAKCFDCHGTHGILPPSDPASTLSPANVVKTCGQCHERSHAGFTTYLTHATHHDKKTYPWLFWSFWGMTSLLAGTMVVAILHTIAWTWRLWRTRHEWVPHRAAMLAAARAPGAKLYRRFDRYQRMQHLTLLISFFTLAFTGMTLKFSHAAWADELSRLLGGTAGMHFLHRLAALALLTVFTVHVVGVNRRRKEAGKSWIGFILGPDSMMFNRADWTELKATIAWFAGRGPRPRYGRFTYWEKFDYMAVFWGVAVIGLTGLLLWFPEVGTYLAPGAAINVATIIHGDEALLAVVFIFTIHFFNANLRPDKFPMDSVMFTGRMTVEELERDKPREYEALVASGELSKHLVEPFAKSVERGFRIFGVFMLAVGLTLIGLIVYAMLFQ